MLRSALGYAFACFVIQNYFDTFPRKFWRGDIELYREFTWWMMFLFVSRNTFKYLYVFQIAYTLRRTTCVSVPVMKTIKKPWFSALYSVHFWVVSNRLACLLNHSEPFEEFDIFIKFRIQRKNRYTILVTHFACLLQLLIYLRIHKLK